MSGFNKVIIMGNLTRDVELRYTGNGTAVADLGIAINTYSKKKDGSRAQDTVFLDCTVWARQAENCAEYLLKTIAFRAGYYYDPAPAPDETMNVLIPNYDFNGVTFGVGYRLNGLHVDAMLEYLMAKERNVDVNDPENEQPGIYNMSIITPGISVSYRW